MNNITFFLYFLIGLFLVYIGYKLGSLVKDQEWNEKLPKIRQDSVKKSREVLTGQFSEQLAPFMPNFPYSPTECKFLGKPIDFIVFKGLDKKEPSEIVFVEVKSGKSNLSTVERKIRDIVKKKKVKWVEYRV